MRTRATSIGLSPAIIRSSRARQPGAHQLDHQRDGETVSERLGAAISAAAGEQLKAAGGGSGGAGGA
jgi:hypothetical protein